MREAAEALSRTLLTLRRWVTEGMIPPPVLTDTTYGHVQYLRGELMVISRVLAEHEREFAYFRKEHVATQTRIHAGVEGYRTKRGIEHGDK